ncbi:DUF1453 domain-containing protein [Streptomyces sp. VRA16 Mangrove soil]|uniref:DUF1453 domain-containing protein n=1 Tax=Streptomyces sp. VRA16 Mangrove soil TaxID=2817434 RepID=UPI001A9D51BF|nr:DUF1453 domain-containing protein [Streptomyces sp. VRA16 Mangrove soil]MBO1335778.1 DUF1453 domain-containing protein [Streptomyces sp. VRA16 Mangrove soil]
MSAAATALTIVVVVALVLVRQFRTERLAADRKWWVLPVILGVVAVRNGSLTDPHHTTGSVVLLAVGLLVSAGIGVGWAYTTRLWVDEQGDAWTKGTAATVGTWLAGIATRAGILGIGLAVGIHLGSSSLMLGFAVSLLVRSGLLMLRADRERSAYVGPVAQPVWEDHR